MNRTNPAFFPRLIILVALIPQFVSVGKAQQPQPNPTPAAQVAPRRPLPKLSSGARGFDLPKEKRAPARLIAVGGGWGAEEDKRKPRLRQRSAQGYYKLGRLYLDQLKFDKAIAPLEKAVKLNPNYLAAYSALGKAYAFAATSGEDIEEMIGETQEKARAKANERAQTLFRLAIKAFEQARRLAPRDPDFHFNLGVLYFNNAEYQKAVESFQEGLRLTPRGKELSIPILESTNLTSVYEMIAEAYLSFGQSENAIKTYQQALELDPDDNKTDVYLALGKIYAEREELDKALAAYQNALPTGSQEEIESREYFGTVLLALGRIHAAKSEYANAAAAFGRAANVYEKELVRYQGYLADATPENRENLEQETDAVIERLIQARYNLGVAELALDHPDRALESFKLVVDLEGGNVDARFNMGFAYLSLGNKEAAREQLQFLRMANSELARELEELINK